MTKSWAVRGYAAAVVVLGLLVGVLGAHVSAGDPDPVAFDAAGRLLLTSGGLHVFDNPYLQVGPLYLLVEGLLSHIAGGCGLSAIVVESVFWSVVLLGWAGWLARALSC